MKPFRLALLDMYNGEANQGMRCIREILGRFADEIDFEEFDVRGKAEIPDLSFDIYLSSGGPGDPLEGDGVWDRQYFQLLDDIWAHNQEEDVVKKQVFFICHSFQMACHHFGIGTVTKRNAMSFGTFPIHKTEAGLLEPIFYGLANPFFVADFRSYQVIRPNEKRLAEMGAQIIALEKDRPHLPYERAIMGVRFSEEIVGTQFHPEADPDGMLLHFMDPDRQREVIEKHSEEKYLRMMEHLNDPDKIRMTHDVILPLFLFRAIRKLKTAELAV